MIARSKHSSPASAASATHSSPRLGATRRRSKTSAQDRWLPHTQTLWLLAADLFAFSLAAIIAHAINVAVAESPAVRAVEGIQERGALWHGFCTLAIVLWLFSRFWALGHYTARLPFWSELGGIVRNTMYAFVADGITAVGLYGIVFGYESVMRWILFVPVAILARQTTRAGLNWFGLWSLRTILVGEQSALANARAALESEPALGYDVVEVVDLASIGDPGDVAKWFNILGRHLIAFVIVALGDSDGGKERAVISLLARERIPFALMPHFANLPVLGFSQQYFFSHDVMLLVYRNNLARPVSRMVKMIFDQLIAAALLVLLAPLLLIIALLVRADGGPALFAHRRIGMNGETFRCLKFRTMVRNADRVLAELLNRDADARAEWASSQKLRDDPRITAIGRFLRRSSLDELPQLLNVLRGEMSLVGPRPIVPAEVSRYGKEITYYYETRPGLTGLWQVSGRSDTSYVRRVQLDVWYVKNWTLWHDIAILLKTVPAVMNKSGAV